MERVANCPMLSRSRVPQSHPCLYVWGGALEAVGTVLGFLFVLSAHLKPFFLSYQSPLSTNMCTSQHSKLSFCIVYWLTNRRDCTKAS